MTLTQKLFGIKGRMLRSQYWGYSIAIGVVFSLIVGLILLIAHARGAPEGELDGLTSVLLLIALIPYLWTAICVQAKRCHDRDRSGWFILISLIPFIGGIWLLIELGFLDGTQGDNRFGPSPKGITSSQVTNVFK